VPYDAQTFGFIETPFFTKVLSRYLSDDAYAKLQAHRCARPETGTLAPGSGGVRKMRSGVASRGKRGGLRVIYYLRRSRTEIWMLTLYGKNVHESIPVHVLKQMKEAIDDEEAR